MKMLLLALPFICFFKKGELKNAVYCLLLQLSLIGWIPAVIWAFSSFNEEDQKKQKVMKMLDEIRKLEVN